MPKKVKVTRKATISYEVPIDAYQGMSEEEIVQTEKSSEGQYYAWVEGFDTHEMTEEVIVNIVEED